MKITRISKSSWFKLKTDNVVIYFDPGYAGYFENQGIPMEELRDKADYVFISHSHKDHLQPEAVDLIVRSDTKIYAPKSCIKSISYKFEIVEPLDEVSEEKIEIRAVNAYNTTEGHSTRKVHHKGDCVGFVVTVDGKNIYHAGDTDVIPEMKELCNIDIAFLPIGGTFVMDIEEAVKATIIINPKFVIPMHEAKQSLTNFKNDLNDFNVVCLNVGDLVEI